MMTIAEVHLLEDRRVAAIRFTLASLLAELATLEADRRDRMRNGVACPIRANPREDGMAES